MHPLRRLMLRSALPMAVALVHGATIAQAEQPARDDRAKRVAAAAEKWVASEQSSQELLGATVKVLLEEPVLGIRWLGDNLPAALADRTELRSKGVTALATHVALEFVRREASCGMVFAGQYAPLQPMQPFVGDLFFQLLLDTPDWYPDTHRIQLVPPLRDLQPTLPDEGRVEQVVAIATDEAIEPEPLRTALACMLWQWGRKQYVQPTLDRLLRDSTEGDAEDRIVVLLQLAELQYRLREYRASAATHLSVQRLASTANRPLRPNDWYSAACVHALTGHVERGIEALQMCEKLQNAPGTDSSHKLERKLLEKDPEIAVLRNDPRFAAIFAAMFPKTDEPASPDVKRETGKAAETGGR
jgi:hypothetical protein